MKTASKLLSMLLLVAMCLSLMGGSAYATGLAPLGEAATQGLAPLGTDDSSTDSGAAGSSTSDLKPLSDDADSSTFDLEKPSTLTAKDNIWTVGDKGYPTLQAAITAAGNNGTVTLNPGVTGAVEDSGATVNATVTIDLSGKDVKVGTLVIDAKGNLTIKNGGSITADSKVVIMKGGVLNDPGKVVPEAIITNNGTVSTEGDTVVTVNGKNFDTVDGALDHAKDLTGSVTITFAHDPRLANIVITAWPTMSCSSLTLNLNDNGIEVPWMLISKPTVINGSNAELLGPVYVQGGSLTVNSGVLVGDVSVGGSGFDGTISINGGEVYELELGGGVLNMSSGTITSLTVVDADKASKLNVSGGNVTEFLAATALYPQKAIKGGTWGVADAYLQYFEGSIVDGYVKTGSNPYTVSSTGSGSGSGIGGSGGTDNGFTYTLYGSPYTKNSTGTVYVDISAQSTNGYWIGTKADATNAQQISSINYSLSANGTGYRLTFTNSYLNSLASGTYYLFAVYGGNTVRMCSTTNPLVITGSDSITVNPGTAAVWPVDSSLWYSGDGTYYFYVTPSLQLVDGKTYDYYEVRIDDVLLGGDKFTYNGYQKFGIAASVMDNLTVGNTHTLTVLTPAGYASCNFRIGATLRPVDTDKHVTGSSKNLQFVCSDAISRVWIGSNELTNLNYGDYWTLSSSGKTITLTAKLMNTQLVAGNTYTLTVQTANGDTPSCSFKILTTAQASASPQTGDESNLALWAAVLVLTGGAAVAILPRLKKHEN